MDEATPKYFDYLGEYGAFLVDRFKIRAEGDSLEADIAGYRRMGEPDDHYWYAGVCIRKVLEQIVESYVAKSTYDYGKMVGEKISGGIDDALIPRGIGYKMKELNRLVCDTPHADCEYGMARHEAAVIQLDLVLRAILKHEGKDVSADEVPAGSDNALVARSESLEEKAEQAAAIAGDKRLIRESREANERAKEAERVVREAKQRIAEMEAKNQQLQLQLEGLKQKETEQLEIIDRFARDRKPAHMRRPPTVASLEASSARLMEELGAARKDVRSKEAVAEKAADEVTELEERVESILGERDFISVLLGAKGHATAEQMRIVNQPLRTDLKTRFIKIEGGAGTGKTLCLLAATINYLEPRQQSMMDFGDGQPSRKALFLCYNKDLSRYVSSLLGHYPELRRNVDVANYDEYLNQLVRVKPKRGFEYLGAYAKDVRYEAGTGNWRIVVTRDTKRRYVRRAIEEITAYYKDRDRQDLLGSSLLNDRDDKNVAWLLDEIEWLEGRYHDFEEGEREYPNAERAGRGGGRRLSKGSIERQIVFNIWQAYFNVLLDDCRYTDTQMVTKLLRSKKLPKYDMVVVDEAQDLNMLHVELFMKFMKDGAFLMIAGDEQQKVYPRDFSMKKVDETITSSTFRLIENMRNPIEVRRFAGRLMDGDAAPRRNDPVDASETVQVLHEPISATVERVRELSTHSNETTVVVTSDVGQWERALRAKGIRVGACAGVQEREDGRSTVEYLRPGVYCFTQLRIKGLEFDNVIVDYPKDLYPDDVEQERRVRYTQFTRARKRLLVRYEYTPPALLRDYYPDYLS